VREEGEREKSDWNPVAVTPAAGEKREREKMADSAREIDEKKNSVPQ
jgi:hypothetical protein